MADQQGMDPIEAVKLGKAIYDAALSGRRGFREDQLEIDDDVWPEIFEHLGRVAAAAYHEAGGTVALRWPATEAMIDAGVAAMINKTWNLPDETSAEDARGKLLVEGVNAMIAAAEKGE